MARRGALLGVILFLFFGALSVDGDNSTADDSGCKRMQTDGGIGEKGILCVGQLTNDRLMVITKDWNVYQLPSNSFAPATNKLYLNDTKPVPIAEKWPQIASNADFKRVRPILYDAFFYANGNVNLFFMETKSPINDVEHSGVTFNVDTQKAFIGFHWPGSNDVVLTSSYQVNKFYQFLETDGRLQLQLYKSNCTDPTSHQNGVCALLPRKVHGENYYVCQKGDKEVTLKTSNVSCTSVNWPVLHGFLFKDKIYLFGSDYVITFPEAVYDKPDQPVEFDTVPYGSFIQCGGNPNPDAADGGTKHPPMAIGLIIAIVLLVLLLLLCCLLFLFREALFSKKGSKGGHSKVGRKGSIGSMLTARSGITSGFGMLSKKRGSGTSHHSHKRTTSALTRKRSSLKKRSSLIRAASGKRGSSALTRRSGGLQTSSRLTGRRTSILGTSNRQSRGRTSLIGTSNRISGGHTPGTGTGTGTGASNRMSRRSSYLLNSNLVAGGRTSRISVKHSRHSFGFGATKRSGKCTTSGGHLVRGPDFGPTKRSRGCSKRHSR